MALDASEDNRSMLPYNYTKVIKIKDVCEDIENNNSSTNLEGFYQVKNVATRYTSNRRGLLAQCLVAGAVSLLSAGAGMPIGYSAVLLPQLSAENSTMYADREIGSWIASIHSLATPVGALLSGPLLDTMGRRGCLQFSAIPLFLGWLVMGFAKNIPVLLAGRVVSGFAVGFMAVPMQVLLGETADPKIRGILIGGIFASYSFGILSIYVLGASLRWDVVALCSTVLPILALVSFCFVPESPAWLLAQGRVERARKALLWLRGGDREQVNTEIAILEARAKADVAQKSLGTSFGQRVASILRTVARPDVLKPLSIINIFNVLQLISGTYVIVFYAVDLVQDIGGKNVDSYIAAIVTAFVRFLFCVLACILILKMGRRTLGMFSAIGTSLASLILAAYTCIKTEESDMDTYVLGICLFAYVGANTVGLFALPGLMVGELLPQKARGIGGGFNFFLFNFFLFIVTKCFPAVNNAVGITGAFTIFGAAALIEATFIYVALPETRNRTLEEIEDYFQQSNLLWITRSRKRTRVGNILVENDS